ncbi:MAG: 8-amino-7-oxononanoate synthase [Elusimicrobia bacterium]|nr:8-amino-7-oxononanoate synthase [Elusimicrobiota bacterium]
MEHLDQEIETFLKTREQEGRLRKLHPFSSRKRGTIYFQGKEYIDFSSNDYLGLAGHPLLVEEAQKALQEFGVGSAASRLLSGDFEIHHHLEENTAKFKNKESCLVFNSGYQANLGILSALYTKNDVIFSDRLNHASIVDGILLSGARFYRFRHNDLNHLEILLKKERNKFKKALLVTETIFSMDGDRPDLKALVVLKEKYHCQLMVDEAHATGIYGKNGSGLVEEEGLSENIDLIMGTFGKALGGFGAYLAASKKTVTYLINTARSFIYSTALPPAIIAANLASLEIVKKEPEQRKKLLASAQYFRQLLKNKGFIVPGSSQIIPVIIGENQKTVQLAQALQKKGYWVLPIRPPTVPQGEARLRFSLTCNHQDDTLRRLTDDICQIRI